MSQVSSSAALMTFVRGLMNTGKSGRAALKLPWSNGQTEGQATKLKMTKRQVLEARQFRPPEEKGSSSNLITAFAGEPAS